MNKQYNFSLLFKKANVFSLILFSLSLFFIFFKGLNYGIDFKGGTLLEIRINDFNIGVSQIRKSVKELNLGDVSVKEFGNKGDYLLKIEQSIDDSKNLITELKLNIKKKASN